VTAVLLSFLSKRINVWHALVSASDCKNRMDED